MSETLPERPAETPPRVDSNSGPHVADDVETSQWPLIAHRLGQIVHRAPVTCSFDTSIRDALATLQHEGVGSMLVVGAEGGLAGIFTLRDLLARVALAGRSMDDPVSAVMTPDPITLPRKALALEAALAMTRHGIHHIVVADQADIAGVVSDKDLSALQQWGLSEIGSALRQADRLPALIDLSRAIRELAGALLKQGVSAWHLTRILSTLNDVLSQRIIDLELAHAGFASINFCWISLGSEGRHEQTLSTDQDNGIIFADDGEPDAVRALLLPVAHRINNDLDACGFPLCRGGIMGSNPRWCLSATEWRETFARWIFDGDPTAVLNATIFFDFRPLHGQWALAEALRGWLTLAAADNQRFLHQLAQNALINRPPLGFVRDFSFSGDNAHPPHTIDLKVNGATLFIDAARVLALSAGVPATNTVERIGQWAEKSRVGAAEAQAWTGAFHFLQLMRLRHQQEQIGRGEPPDNHLNPDHLDDLERRILKESLRLAKSLQSRLALDYYL